MTQKNENKAPPLPIIQSLTRLTRPLAPDATPDEMCALMANAMYSDADGEQLLIEQAQALNAIFHRMIKSGIGGTNRQGEEVANYTSRDSLTLALKAQSQTRQTLDALSKIKTRKAFCSPHTKTKKQSE